MKPSPEALGRRALLTIGAAGALALLDGCAPTIGKAVPVHPDRSPPPDFPVPQPVRPTPNVCPRDSATVQKPNGPLVRVPCSGTNIALTIDDGPDPVWTPQVLKVLARYRITATFCMIGRNATAHPDLVAAVVDGGHQVANHTYTHRTLTRLPAATVREEIGRATDAISAAAKGHRPVLFRAPGGVWSPEILAECAAQQLRPLGWSIDPRDWSRPGTRHIVEVILTGTRPGSIILGHDGGGDRQQTLDALRITLPRLLDAGFHFVRP